MESINEIISEKGIVDIITSYKMDMEEYTMIKKYDDDWEKICIEEKLTEDFIEKYHDKVDWSCVSAFQKLSEDFIKKWQDNVNWYHIFRSQKVSEDFILENYKIRRENNNIRFSILSVVSYQRLSADFIEKFMTDISLIQDVVLNEFFWYNLSSKQKLTEDFIARHSEQVIWEKIFKHQKLSRVFKKTWRHRVSFYHRLRYTYF